MSYMIFIFGVCALAIGAFLTSIFIGWVWGVKNASAELAEGCPGFAKWAWIWAIFIRFICPIMIFIIFIRIFWS